MPAYADYTLQAVSGVAPPQSGEALIRDAWPSVTANHAAASFALWTYSTVILSPLGFLALAPLYFGKLFAVLPGFSGFAVRYRLTNRRLMVCTGFIPKPVEGKIVLLADIADVRLTTDGNTAFFVAATLDILGHNGQTLLHLPGVPEAESYRNMILQARNAWTPEHNHVA